VAEHGPSEKLCAVELGEYPPPERIVARTYITTTPDPERRPFFRESRLVEVVYVRAESSSPDREGAE
jgi:hypothetical protein